MTKYHCPYCSPRYQIHIERADGVMVCGQCGDRLIKVPFIKPTQIFALVAASAFITPLIVMIFTFVQDQNKIQPKRPLSPMALIQVSLSAKNI